MGAEGNWQDGLGETWRLVAVVHSIGPPANSSRREGEGGGVEKYSVVTAEDKQHNLEGNRNIHKLDAKRWDSSSWKGDTRKGNTPFREPTRHLPGRQVGW